MNERGTRFCAHNRCLLTLAVCESNPDQLKCDRVLQEVSRLREPAPADPAHVARKPHAQALGPVESIRVHIAIYRCRKCFTPNCGEHKRCCMLHAECTAGPVESERCMALEHVEATKFLVAKELFLRLNF